MSEKPTQNVLAEDVSAQNPISQTTYDVLSTFNVYPGQVEEYAQRFKDAATGSLDELDMALALSRRESSIEPIDGKPVVEGWQEDDMFELDEARKQTAVRIGGMAVLEASNDDPALENVDSKAISAYIHVRNQPARKFARDTEIVMQYLRSTGPDNTFRQSDGFDAMFEMASVKKLLQDDFEALSRENLNSSEAPRPELRMTEALVAEEMALSWRFAALHKAKQGDSFDARIANVDDPNLFSEQELESLSPEQRWVLIGAKLADEAAALYEPILASKTATIDQRLEAATRLVDMRVRGHQLRIQEAKLAKDSERVRQYAQKIIDVSRTHLLLIEKEWTKLHDKAARLDRDLSPDEQELRGSLFEYIVVATERQKLMSAGKGFTESVRLAMPREDGIDRSIVPLVDRSKMRVNHSSDVIIENLAGVKVKTIQVKSMRQEKGERMLSDREKQIVYPKDLIDTVYIDNPGYEKYLVRS